MYRPVLVTPPASTPVSRTEVKAQLDISFTEKDTLIDGLIAAATAYLDGWSGILGRCLVTQTWRQDFDRFGRCLRLPLFPVASLTSVKYDDADGVEQTVSASDYTLLCDDLGFYVLFKDTYSFPSINVQRPAVRVAYVAGDATADERARQAMFLMIRHWFDNPTAVNVGNIVNSVPLGVDALLAPLRRTRF